MYAKMNEPVDVIDWPWLLIKIVYKEVSSQHVEHIIVQFNTLTVYTILFTSTCTNRWGIALLKSMNLICWNHIKVKFIIPL